MALGDREGRTLVLTGGPGGGKSTVAARLAARFPQRVVVVSEVATALLTTILPVPCSPKERRVVQRAIYQLQCGAEEVYRGRLRSGQWLVLDRGLVDGAAYWPEGRDEFAEAMGTTLNALRARYDAVLHLETAAQGGHCVEANNRARAENRQQAVEIDQRLMAAWSAHPQFRVVRNEAVFEAKVDAAFRQAEGFILS